MLPYYDLLGVDDIARIHHAALEILERMGVMIDHPETLEKLAAAGARVDSTHQTARFSERMVAAALELAPKTLICGGRTSEFDFEANPTDRMPFLRAAAGCISIFASGTGDSRPLLRRDAVEAARVADALENVSVGCTLTPSDLPLKTYDVHTLKDLLLNCRKHVWALTIDSKNLRFQLEMLAAVAGSSENIARRPPGSGIFCMIPPMYIPGDEIERLLLYGRYRIPVRMTVIPIKGASSPHTLAGTLASINAQFLGCLVVQQVLCPGLPTWYYGGSKVMDMYSGAAVPNLSPENMLIAAGVSQLGRHYGLPAELSLLSFPGCQMHQYMFHLGACVSWAVSAGIAGIGSAGSFDNSNIWSPEALVLADEFMRYFGKLFEGYRVDTDTLAVEAMIRVGHRGHFLEDPHTIQHLREEMPYRPALLDWRSHESWCQTGFETIIDRAAGRLEDIRQHHEVPPPEKAVCKELDRIAAAADRELIA